MNRKFLCVFLFLLSFGQCALGDDTKLRVCFWNVESGGASSNVNKTRIASESGVDIWGLSEVQGSTDAAKYLIGAADGENADYESILGTTGSSDRLQIIFNADKLELISTEELHDININSAVRAPLVATFKHNNSDKQFVFMVNHLYRSKNWARHTQAQKINNWADDKDMPVICGGDFNFDWHYQNGATNHDKGYDYLIEDGVFTWVKPDVLVPTNSSSHKSVLDFVFVAGDAITWPAESTILVKPNEWPDGNSRSDHRPVDCIFTIDGGSNAFRDTEPTRISMKDAEEMTEDDVALAPRVRDGHEMNRVHSDILQRLTEIEQELTGLRKMLDSSNDE